MAPCIESQKQCIGGKCRDDDSKIVCGINLLKKGKEEEQEQHLQRQQHNNNNCVIYAIGGDNQWDFELDLLDKTPCEIHTFDCTGDIKRFQIPPLKNAKDTGNKRP